MKSQWLEWSKQQSPCRKHNTTLSFLLSRNSQASWPLSESLELELITIQMDCPSINDEIAPRNSQQFAWATVWSFTIKICLNQCHKSDKQKKSQQTYFHARQESVLLLRVVIRKHLTSKSVEQRSKQACSQCIWRVAGTALLSGVHPLPDAFLFKHA